MTMQAQDYWNTIGVNKDFEDPIYLDRLSSYLTPQSKVIEYGCGYGRLMKIMLENGYGNLVGFDFSSKMIERGLRINPNLDLRLLEEAGKIPCQNESVDAVMMSTVLCCLIQEEEQVKLIAEIYRVLKKGGVFYLSDFLVCDNERYKEKYQDGFERFGKWGTYTTSENLTVRHLNTRDVMGLLHHFDIQWFEQFDFKTMNQHPARTFYCIGKKR